MKFGMREMVGEKSLLFVAHEGISFLSASWLTTRPHIQYKNATNYKLFNKKISCYLLPIVLGTAIMCIHWNVTFLFYNIIFVHFVGSDIVI